MGKWQVLARLASQKKSNSGHKRRKKFRNCYLHSLIQIISNFTHQGSAEESLHPTVHLNLQLGSPKSAHHRHRWGFYPHGCHLERLNHRPYQWEYLELGCHHREMMSTFSLRYFTIFLSDDQPTRSLSNLYLATHSPPGNRQVVSHGEARWWGWAHNTTCSPLCSYPLCCPRPGPSTSKGIIAFYNIAPSLIAKFTWPYFISKEKIRYTRWLWLCAVLSTTSMLVSYILLTARLLAST